MKLSTRVRYGARALLDIALNSEGRPVLLKDIAQRQQISLNYLQQLVTPLIVGGVLRSVRGPRGGVSLAKPPHEIKLAEVVELLEGSLALAECVTDPESCDRSGSCATRDVWVEIKAAMNGILESTTLADLVERQKSKNQANSVTYDI